ncbi:MAG: LacI family transcriptional regulator [Roseburia sp.]|nr:LacI family transcriptional regulator [Roseburia sp.]
MVTIKDIARESGYSVSTVSRVLNNRRDVSPAAKKKIEQVVAEYNFVPNDNAKHLKQMGSKTVVILVKGSGNMLFANIVEEIQSMVERTQYTPVVTYLDENEDEVQRAIRISWERKPMGILFLGGDPENFKRQFDQVDVPSVLVTNQGKNFGVANLASVATDDVLAAETAVDYLLEKGHQNIGIIGGDLNFSYTSRQRYQGCIQSFEKHHKAFDEIHSYSAARFSFEGAYGAMEKLLAMKPDLTAVFAMSDVMAIGAIRALKDHGRKVPEDISVIGFDGITLADYYNPKLATIRQQYKLLARRSVEILFHLVDFNEDPVHEVIPFELVQGESVISTGLKPEGKMVTDI